MIVSLVYLDRLLQKVARDSLHLLNQNHVGNAFLRS